MQGMLLLENGSRFDGRLSVPEPDPGSPALNRHPSAARAEGPWLGEVVFNTSMTGYQEILTDPSYAGQIVVLTHPQTGNYGVSADHDESRRPWAAGLVTLEPCEAPNHWASRGTLSAFLRHHAVPVLQDCDTRALTRLLRRSGTLRGALVPVPDGDPAPTEVQALLGRLAGWRLPRDLVRLVTAGSPAVAPRGVGEGGGGGGGGGGGALRVALLDFGAKRGIVRCLEERGVRVSVLPAGTPAHEVDSLQPDAVVLSNGPGDPADCSGYLPAVRQLASRYPVLGICLGHQLVATAFGARTGPLPFGHRGANHTVRDLRSGRLLVTSHNHGFTVLEESLPPHLEVTHRHLHDRSIEGLRHRHWPVWGVQFHPEASPGPQDAAYVFDDFLAQAAAHRRLVTAC